MSVKNEVVEMSAKIKEVLEVNKASISEKEDSSIYEDCLPEELDIKTVKAVNNHNTVFVAGAAMAVGELALDSLSKEKSIDRVTGSVKMAGADNVSFTVDRSKTFKNHLTGGKESTKFGVMGTNYEVRAGKNGGQLKAVRSHIAELAMKKLK